MKKMYLLPLNFLIILLIFSMTVSAQESTHSVIARMSNNNKKYVQLTPPDSKTESASTAVEQINIAANWIGTMSFPTNVTALDELKVDKVTKGATKITGVATKGAKVTVKIFRDNKPKISPPPVTANAANGSFIVLFPAATDAIEENDTIFISQESGGTTGEITVTVAAQANLQLTVDQVNQGDKKITGKTNAGATVKFYRKDSTKAVKTTTTDPDGSFVIREIDPAIECGEDLIIEAVLDQQTKRQDVDVVCPMDLTKANLIGLAPFGVVTSQQADRFSQSDPFGGFLVGYVSQSRQRRICKVLLSNGTEETCHYDTPKERKNDRQFFRDFDAKKELSGYKWEVGELEFRRNYNFRVQGIFQADGRKAEIPDMSMTPPQEPKTFIASRKTFDLNMQFWREYGVRDSFNAFTIGPYLSFGGSFALSKNELIGETVSVDNTTTTDAVSSNDAKLYYEGGTILNFYRPKRTDDSNLYMQAIIAAGHYEAYADLRPSANTKWRGVGKLRVFPTGLNRDFFAHGVATPMFGVDLNAGKGPDQVKFFFGMVFNITKLLTKMQGAPPTADTATNP